MPLDKATLLAHIKDKADHPNILIHAVLEGLAMAILRGDFDESYPQGNKTFDPISGQIGAEQESNK